MVGRGAGVVPPEAYDRASARSLVHRQSATPTRHESQKGGSGHMNRTLLYFFLAGAATGATVALLTAPQSGAETRRKLKQAKEHLADRASRVGSAISEAYRSATTAGKEGFVRTMNGSPARASG